MSGTQRMRRPPAETDDGQAEVLHRLVRMVEALTLSVNDPADGLKAQVKTIETRVMKNEGSLDVVLKAFRLGEDHGGGAWRRIVGATPVRLALDIFSAAMGIVLAVQILAPAIAAFAHTLAHGVMTHPITAG